MEKKRNAYMFLGEKREKNMKRRSHLEAYAQTGILK